MVSKDNILITTDFNEKSLDTNLKYTKFLVKKFGSNVSLIHVVEEAGFFSKIFGDSSEDAVDKMKHKFKKLALAIEKDYGLNVTPVIRYGRVTKEINKYAEEIDCDLIVIGTSNSDEGDNAIGANAHRMIRIAECPVLTLRNDIEPRDIKNILLPIEQLLSSRQKVKNAIEWAKSYDAKITLIAGKYSKDEDEVRHLNSICKNTKNFITDHGIECDIVFLENVETRNDFAIKITEYANNPDNNVDLIIVMGRDESTEFYISSTSQKVIGFANVPVLCVPIRDIGMNVVPSF